jgi:hypothetical protein
VVLTLSKECVDGLRPELKKLDNGSAHMRLLTDFLWSSVGVLLVLLVAVNLHPEECSPGCPP